MLCDGAVNLTVNFQDVRERKAKPRLSANVHENDAAVRGRSANGYACTVTRLYGYAPVRLRHEHGKWISDPLPKMRKGHRQLIHRLKMARRTRAYQNVKSTEAVA
jgi:hypothetical protein